MKLLKSMRKLLCGQSCTKDACAVRSDALSSVIGESPPIRPRASVGQRHRRRVIPLSQDILHRSHLPPIPGADKEENDKDEVPAFDKTKDWGKHLYPAVLLMLDGVKRAGAVYDISSKSGDIMHMVYSPASVVDSGVSDTIADLMWRAHLPLIPEEEEIDSVDDSDSDKEEEAENVNKEVLEDTVPGNVTGASGYQEAMQEVLALMAQSSQTGDTMHNVHGPGLATAHLVPINISNAIWRPHLPLIPEEEEVDDFNGNGNGKMDAEKVSKEVLEGTVSGKITGASDFQEAMDEVLALMAESSDSSDMRKVYRSAPVTARGIPDTIANVIYRPHLPVIPEEEEIASVDNSISGKEEEAESINKEVLEVTAAGSVADASGYQEAMNEVLALMAESSDSGAMDKVYSPAPAPATACGIPASIANVVLRPRLPVIPEEEEGDSVDDDDSSKEASLILLLEGTMASNVVGASDFQVAMNEVLALMAKSAESVDAMHNVLNPSPVTTRGFHATIANVIWKPHLSLISEVVETVDGI